MNRLVFTLAATALCGVMSGVALAQAPSGQPPETTLQASSGGALPRFSVEGFVHTGYLRGDGYALVSQNPSLQGGGLGAQVRVVSAGLFGLSLGGALSSAKSESAWERDTTSFEETNVALGAVVDVLLVRHLRPYVQLQGGMSFADVSLGYGASALRDEVSLPFGTVSGGVRAVTTSRVWWPGGPTLAFSAFVEGGYTVAGSYDFRVAPSVGPDELPTGAVPLGSLARSRAHSRLGLALHF